MTTGISKGALLGCFALLAPACAAETSAPAGKGASAATADLPGSLECHAAYRETASAAFDERTLAVTRGGPEQKAVFTNLSFSATYTYSPLEDGAGLVIVVGTGSANAPGEVHRSLYQFGGSVIDQFAGGHGFTGLQYVASPTTPSQLQFWCTAASSSAAQK